MVVVVRERTPIATESALPWRRAGGSHFPLNQFFVHRSHRSSCVEGSPLRGFTRDQPKRSDSRFCPQVNHHSRGPVCVCVCVVLLSVGSSVRSRHRNARACSVVLLAPKKGAVLRCAALCLLHWTLFWLVRCINVMLY